MFEETLKKEMLALARKAIASYLLSSRPLKLSAKDVSPPLRQKGCVFVTLTIDDALRGCIGHLEPVMPLYLDIVENAISAAFRDPRFMPLDKDELDRINIEISLIGPPKKLRYDSPEDLLSKITPLRDGVTISLGPYKATYLPQVWEELTDKEAFMCSLCIKAGMDPYSWKNAKPEVETYQVEKFSEN
jgi:AmmeMemoRadiSam system protein A